MIISEEGRAHIERGFVSLLVLIRLLIARGMGSYRASAPNWELSIIALLFSSILIIIIVIIVARAWSRSSGLFAWVRLILIVFRLASLLFRLRRSYAQACVVGKGARETDVRWLIWIREWSEFYIFWTKSEVEQGRMVFMLIVFLNLDHYTYTLSAVFNTFWSNYTNDCFCNVYELDF